MADNIKIKISNLYKVFGSNPAAAMTHVRNGASKQDLLTNTGMCLACAISTSISRKSAFR